MRTDVALCQSYEDSVHLFNVLCNLILNPLNFSSKDVQDPLIAHHFWGLHAKYHAPFFVMQRIGDCTYYIDMRLTANLLLLSMILMTNPLLLRCVSL